ncbi:helicase-related protein [Spectribacter hydrogenooxidans]|uniref:Helicase-related protein n=1 Tax=Spectribacter hydrogenoxidans TaxID=3075608 RepID=A0ABU3BZZ9_9GAMM|nr:helicase-related protein [Salinisphaera sp. W335]MDT0634888.1 helicase-related protein [Salinisphaera sp. W335]
MSDTGSAKPDAERMLAALKPFQRDTVDHVFRRMYTDPDCTRRFLVADEVGLGKTLVARGLIARAIDHLEDKIERIDIVYICSNGDIARQNLQRLNITEDHKAAGVGRLTMLPAMLPHLDARLNFVAFTPGTSFNLGSSSGRREERALLYWMLEDLHRLPTNARGKARGQGAAQLFQSGVSDLGEWKRFLANRWLPGIGAAEIERTLLDRFEVALQHEAARAAHDGRPSLQSRIEAACARLKGRHPHNAEWPLWRETQAITGELRVILAHTCLSALEPDLVILDEFQRFKELLDPDNQAGELAHSLFNYADEHTAVRTLLLSATPYKMYTLHAESDEEDHYKDFIQTLRFLTGSDATTPEISELLKGMRRALYRTPAAGPDEALEYRAALEARLRKVMVRTERASGSASGDDMLHEVMDNRATLSARDARRYLGLQRIVRALNGPDMIEYWKSAPYLLNFMDAYKIKRDLLEAIKTGANIKLTRELKRHRDLLLSHQDIIAYEPIESANARLGSLFDDIEEHGMWRMLWMPPSLPPYRLRGAYADVNHTRLTKRLIFSAWHVVPKTIAGLVSYDTERRLHKRFNPEAVNTQEARSAQTRPLRLDISEGRLTGLPLFALLYPSHVLARSGAEALHAAARRTGDDPPELETVLAHAEASIRALLPPDAMRSKEGRPDEAWYWVSPILLDLMDDAPSAEAWWNRRNLAHEWTQDKRESNAEGWLAHLARTREVVEGWRPDGPPPADLVSLLAEVAIAGPATSALRSLRAVSGYREMDNPVWLRDGAARIGWVYRRLFNQIETSVLIRGEYGPGDPMPYWRKALRYALDGGLPAVNDEYFHVLAEFTAASDRPPATVCERVVGTFHQAVALPPSRVEWDEINVDTGEPEIRPRQRLRTHFALRFGQANSDEGGKVTHEDQVRAAFNSPFWPFVLASTSVGQEGLDFHPYCHAIIHWNLPSNPVDMEQREGRVHRYKGHAVRKNLAHQYSRVGRVANGKDRWRIILEHAKHEHGIQSRGLVPEWSFPTEQGSRVERHVPVLSLSRDVQRYEHLRTSLAAYRMVFGHTRQEDLLAYLLKHIKTGELTELAQRLRIDLVPSHRVVP